MKKIIIYTSLFLFILILSFGFWKSLEVGKKLNNAQSKDGQIKVIFWHAMGGPLGRVLNKMVDKFNKTHPHIYVIPQSMGNYNALSQKLLASAVAKNQPVIAQAYEAWIAKFVRGNLLVPFDEFIGDTEKFKKDFYPVLIKDNLYNGKLYSLPFNKSTPVLYYNKDLFRSSGIVPPNPPTTWKQFESYAERITQKHKKILGYVGAGTVSDFECFLIQNGGKLLSDDGKKILFNSPEGVRALQFLLNLKYLHHAADYYIGSGFQFQTDFITKRAAMMIGSSVSRLFIENKLMFNWGMAPLLKGKNKGILIYGTNIVLFKNATLEQQKAAWEFIQWFISPENQAYWAAKTGYLPARKSSLQTETFKKALKEYPDLKNIIKGMENGFIDPRTSVWFTARQNLEQAIGNIFLSEKIASAYKQYTKKLNSNSVNQEAAKKLDILVQSEIKKELDKAAKLTQKWLE